MRPRSLTASHAPSSRPGCRPSAVGWTPSARPGAFISARPCGRARYRARATCRTQRRSWHSGRSHSRPSTANRTVSPPGRRSDRLPARRSPLRQCLHGTETAARHPVATPRIRQAIPCRQTARPARQAKTALATVYQRVTLCHQSGWRVRVTAVISSPDLGVLAVAAVGVLCAFCCVVGTLPEQCLRRRPRANPLVAAVFRTEQLLRERCSATCPRRRRPGQVRHTQGGLQISA
jgi:hypothetical protein